MDMESIDRNFCVEAVSEDGIDFYNVEQPPFSVHGLMRENGMFCRMPMAVASATNERVENLNTHTAGGRVRFVTDSAVVHIRACMHNLRKLSNCAFTGSIGFDCYADEGEGTRYAGTFVPPFSITDGYSSCVNLGLPKRRVITVNFPFYSGVSTLMIGVETGARLEQAPAYRVQAPVVYYGSSITQGGCASRPGATYPSIVSRLLDCEYVNLGFSGNAKGEKNVAEYISGLQMSAFVYDYDHNAPTVAHLADTHQRMFSLIRNRQPTVPIIMLSRPTSRLSADERQRLEVIRRTYERACAQGDKNVYLLEGSRMIGERIAEIWSVDGCHPNDSGFAAMAYSVAEILSDILRGC